MARPEPRSAGAYLLTGLVLHILLGLNVWISTLLEGRLWAFVPLIGVAAVQAVLLAVFLMNLPHAGKVAWAYAGTGIFLLIIACLALTDYFTRTSPLADAPPKTETR
jgi:hypothetical protein